MEDDYFSVESILSENQKIQCTFKIDIPDMGHLDGGNERDVRQILDTLMNTHTDSHHA